MPTERKQHQNDEPTVLCPVAGCDAEPLSRAVHLHVMQSAGDGHGEQGTIPSDVDLDAAEEVGSREVEMQYPESRDQETVARLCPYCGRPYRGKQGVMIHLGQVEGRKDHPNNATDRHNPEDFAVVEVDSDGNIVEVVEEAAKHNMPSTEKRIGIKKDVKEYVAFLEERGLDEEADKAKTMLLD